ncbi:hypothetical protein [Streptomyces sp. G45]|uniref:hypothetical protein n=1 Tax=Streptomyces sp. G45 TaxID=3406627 RepID=UPI003C1AE1B3
MRSPVRAGVLALAAVALVASCTTGSTDEGDGKPSAKSTRRALDLSGDPRAAAPLAFEKKAAHVLPTAPDGLPIALYGRAAWVPHASGVRVYQLSTGRAVTDIRTRNKPAYDLPEPWDLSKKQAALLFNRVPSPEPVRVGRTRAMLTVVPVRLAEQRGGSAQAGFEVIAARADNGKVIWRLPVDIHGVPDGKLGALVLWAGDDVATVTWTEDGNLAGTFAVALDEPRMLWQRADLWHADGFGDRLLGFRDEGEDEHALAGVAAASGRDLWAKDLPGGVTWAVESNGAPLTKLDDDSEQSRLVDIATGAYVLPKRHGLTKRMSCDQGEGGTVLLCASKQDGALAVDATGKVLWRRKAGSGPHRWNATVEAEFRDRFYVKGGKSGRSGKGGKGGSSDDGTFVVDGRTGRTVSTGTGVVPDRVNAYAALVYTAKGTEVHRAKR